MIQQQRFSGTLMSTPQRLYQENGMRSFQRGMMMCMGRESVFTVAMLAATPIMQQKIRKKYPELSPGTALAAGALASSCVGATLTHPVDTIKTCMQGDIGGRKYQNALHTARVLMDEHGVAKGLFKGLTWRISLITTTFFLVNSLRQQLAPICFPQQLGLPNDHFARTVRDIVPGATKVLAATE
jgi:solute carrier family 25 carnitine/acylcarnitine transporter 20/29